MQIKIQFLNLIPKINGPDGTEFSALEDCIVYIVCQANLLFVRTNIKCNQIFELGTTSFCLNWAHGIIKKW